MRARACTGRTAGWASSAELTQGMSLAQSGRNAHGDTHVGAHQVCAGPVAPHTFREHSHSRHHDDQQQLECLALLGGWGKARSWQHQLCWRSEVPAKELPCIQISSKEVDQHQA